MPYIGGMTSFPIMKLWPIAAAIGVGLVGWGTLKERTATVSGDHDAIVELRTEQRQIKTQIEKVDAKVDKVLEKLDR